MFYVNTRDEKNLQGNASLAYAIVYALNDIFKER